jgi:hypothetical protein
MQDKLKEMFNELAQFELEMRIFITKTLRAFYSDNWVKQAIPKAIREDWRTKKENDIKQGRIPESNPINYADFSHYRDIILHNWKIFSIYFEDKEKLRVRLDDINNLCRIVTMHTRSLTDDEIGMGKVSIRWLRSKMEILHEENRKGKDEVEEIQPIFRANPFMVEEGATFLRAEKRPSEETLKRIDLQLIDSNGTPLFAEIKWTGIDENQVRSYKKLISAQYKKFRLMWIIPNDMASATQHLKKLGVEVKVYSKKNMMELIEIRSSAKETLAEIRELITKPFDYLIQNEKVTFEDVIRACYFDGQMDIDGKTKRVGLKQSAIGRYLDLVRCIINSPLASSLPELTMEFIYDALVAPYCYKSGRFWVIAKDGFRSIVQTAHIHSSLSNVINQVWKSTNYFHMKFKNRIHALYENDKRKYDLTFRVMNDIAVRRGLTLNVKTIVTDLKTAFTMVPSRPIAKIFHGSSNQWIQNSVDTSGYENDFAKRIIEIATLKRILIPNRGITIMWVLAPKYQHGKITVDRVPCQSFIFNKDHTLYLEVP